MNVFHDDSGIYSTLILLRRQDRHLFNSLQIAQYTIVENGLESNDWLATF